MNFAFVFPPNSQSNKNRGLAHTMMLACTWAMMGRIGTLQRLSFKRSAVDSGAAGAPCTH